LAIDTSIKQYFAGNKVWFKSFDMSPRDIEQRIECNLVDTKFSDIRNRYCDLERIQAAWKHFRGIGKELGGRWEYDGRDYDHPNTVLVYDGCDIHIVDIGGIVKWEYPAIKAHLVETGTVRVETARLNRKGAFDLAACSDYVLKWKLVESSLVSKAEFKLVKCRTKAPFQFTGTFNFERMRMEWQS
jgi:hypothetical protein